jgi:DNA-directed RNA polymerase specialized sigma24 family protein
MLYYDTNVLNNKLAEMISKISNKLSYANNFINYSYREEMVGDGIIRMMKALIAKKYNHVKGTNPFSYFTRIAFNAFRNRIKKEKHIHETHEKYQQEFLMMSENYNNVLKNGNKRITKNKE